MQGLGFGLEEGGGIVLSKTVLDLVASEEAATDDLGRETGSGEEKGCRGTGQGCDLSLDGRGGGLV